MLDRYSLLAQQPPADAVGRHEGVLALRQHLGVCWRIFLVRSRWIVANGRDLDEHLVLLTGARRVGVDEDPGALHLRKEIREVVVGKEDVVLTGAVPRDQIQVGLLPVDSVPRLAVAEDALVRPGPEPGLTVRGSRVRFGDNMEGEGRVVDAKSVPIPQDELPHVQHSGALPGSILDHETLARGPGLVHPDGDSGHGLHQVSVPSFLCPGSQEELFRAPHLDRYLSGVEVTPRVQFHDQNQLQNTSNHREPATAEHVRHRLQIAKWPGNPVNSLPTNNWNGFFPSKTKCTRDEFRIVFTERVRETYEYSG